MPNDVSSDSEGHSIKERGIGFSYGKDAEGNPEDEREEKRE